MSGMVLRGSLLVGMVLALAAAVWWWMAGYGRDSPSPDPLVADRVVRADEPPRRRYPAATARSAPTLWRRLDERSVTAGTPPYEGRWSKAGRVLVDVSEAVAAARTWRVGDRVGVEIPQLGERYEGPIDRIDVGPGHASAARGLAADSDGHMRRFVVTVGPGRVFAYVDTRAGSYELVGNDRLAWLLPSSNMMAGIDFSRPDYIIPGATRETADPEPAR